MDVTTYAILKAKLDSKASLVDGKVPADQLPSYVDDIEEYDSLSGFPAEGEEGKIYVAKDTNLTYRWGGSEYVQVNASSGVLSFASASQFPASGQEDVIYIAEDVDKQYRWDGSGYAELSKSTVYQPIPQSWDRNSTTATLASSAVNDPDAVEGMSFLGKIYCSDLPASIVQGEAVIEIISSDQANGKNIHIILTSADTAPYHWEYSYVKINGSYVSPAGWVGYQPELVSGTNIKTVNSQSLLGSGDLAISGGTSLYLHKWTFDNDRNLTFEYDGFISNNPSQVTDATTLATIMTACQANPIGYYAFVGGYFYTCPSGCSVKLGKSTYVNKSFLGISGGRTFIRADTATTFALVTMTYDYTAQTASTSYDLVMPSSSYLNIVDTVTQL